MGGGRGAAAHELGAGGVEDVGEVAAEVGGGDARDLGGEAAQVEAGAVVVGFDEARGVTDANGEVTMSAVLTACPAALPPAGA